MRERRRQSSARSSLLEKLLRHQEQCSEFRLRFSKFPATKPVKAAFINQSNKEVPGQKFDAPEVFCLDNNYMGVVGYLYSLRAMFFLDRKLVGGRHPVRYASLESVRDMSMPSALVLVAEYSRALISKKVRKVHVDDGKWPEFIVSSFRQLGFYELVNATGSYRNEISIEASELGWVKFRTSSIVDGKMAARILQDLEELAGDDENRLKLYPAIVEAITNCHNHAYPADQRRLLEPCVPNWWAAGAYSRSEDALYISVYDQGVGIPATLKLQPSKLEMIFRNFVSLGRPRPASDWETIEAALEYGRTSTGRTGRGNGLWEMGNLVRGHEESYMEVLSGSGRVVLRGNGVVERAALEAPFFGTLINWRIQLPQRERGENANGQLVDR